MFLFKVWKIKLPNKWPTKSGIKTKDERWAIHWYVVRSLCVSTKCEDFCNSADLLFHCGSAVSCFTQSASSPPDSTQSTNWMDKRHQTPCLRPRGTTGTTPNETTMARPANWSTPRARKATMYVVSSILPPYPPPPTDSYSISRSLCKWFWSYSLVLVDMKSRLLWYWTLCFSVVSYV